MSDGEEANSICNMRVKSVLIGESGVGKTSIIKQFVEHIFNPNCATSVSSSFSSRMFNVSNNQESIIFDVWDTAGQEKYRSLAKIFYKDAKIIIFVYDITEKHSFESLKQYWYKEVLTHCTNNPIFAVVGNKIDLYENEKKGYEKEAKKWANSINAPFFTTSAKSNIGIDLLFDEVGKKILDPDYKYGEEEDKKMKNNYEKRKKKKKKEKIDIDDNNMQIDDCIKVEKQKNNNKKDKKDKKVKKCC